MKKIRLSKEVLILKSKINDIEEQNLIITIDIIGIPMTKNENCIFIVEDISLKTNTAINVLKAYRVNHLGLKQSKIVVNLATNDMRKNLIRNVNSKKLFFHKPDKLKKKKVINLSHYQMLTY